VPESVQRQRHVRRILHHPELRVYVAPVGLAVTNYVNLTVENCWNAGALRHGFIFHHVDNLALRDSWYGNGIDEALVSRKPTFMES
jgi:hypothetical protein